MYEGCYFVLKPGVLMSNLPTVPPETKSPSHSSSLSFVLAVVLSFVGVVAVGVVVMLFCCKRFVVKKKKVKVDDDEPSDEGIYHSWSAIKL